PVQRSSSWMVTARNASRRGCVRLDPFAFGPPAGPAGREAAAIPCFAQDGVALGCGVGGHGIRRTSSRTSGGRRWRGNGYDFRALGSGVGASGTVTGHSVIAGCPVLSCLSQEVAFHVRFFVPSTCLARVGHCGCRAGRTGDYPGGGVRGWVT